MDDTIQLRDFIVPDITLDTKDIIDAILCEWSIMDLLTHVMDDEDNDVDMACIENWHKEYTEENYAPGPQYLPCPHCGASGDTIELSTIMDDGMDLSQWRIICNIMKQGCGASSGIVRSPIQAKTKWNNRQ